MGLESVTHVDDLVSTNPASSDAPSQGDDHLRNIKSAIKMTLADADAPAVQGYYADSGAADAYVVTLSPAPSGYTTKMFIRMKAANANTGASTINVNSLGVKTIQKFGSALEKGDIRANYYYDLVYDGTYFQMLGFTSTNIPVASFSAEYDNGNKSTDFTVDWNNGNKQKVTMTGNATLTFTAPPGPCALQMKFIQDGTGSRVVTHPTIKTQGGTSIVLTTTASAEDIVNYYYDGSSYYAILAADWS